MNNNIDPVFHTGGGLRLTINILHTGFIVGSKACNIVVPLLKVEGLSCSENYKYMLE